MSFDVAPAGPRYQASEATRAFYRELLERLRGVGGIESAGAISHLPMYRFGWNNEMRIEGGNPWGPGEAPLVENRWVAGDYVATVGIAAARSAATPALTALSCSSVRSFCDARSVQDRQKLPRKGSGTPPAPLRAGSGPPPCPG